MKYFIALVILSTIGFLNCLQYNTGLNFSPSISDYAEREKLGLGGFIDVEFLYNEHLSLTFAAAYNHWDGKTQNPNDTLKWDSISLSFGPKYYFPDSHLFATLELGYFRYGYNWQFGYKNEIEGDFSTSNHFNKIAWSPGLGTILFNNKNYSLFLHTKYIVIESFDFLNIALGISF